MFIIYGRKTGRIKKYTDHQHTCPNCKAFDLTVNVYREYYHLYYIPAFPVGIKLASIQCNQCGTTVKSETIAQQYEQSARTPSYMFTWPILGSVLIGFIINSNYKTQKEKAAFVNDPKVGDVYKIRKEENGKTSYYFLRLTRVDGDTIMAYHNNLVYSRIVNKLNVDDYFDQSEELIFLKPQIKKMLDIGEINSVNRYYGGDDGFNRMR